jgi:hypothetical protein
MPELQQLFTEWLTTIKDGAMKRLREKGRIGCSTLTEALGVTLETATYLVAH